jgi:hypothetical protein
VFLNRIWNRDFSLIIPIRGLANGSPVRIADGSVASCVRRRRRRRNR